MHGRGRGGTTESLEVQSAKTDHQTHHAFGQIRPRHHPTAPIAMAQQHATVDGPPDQAAGDSDHIQIEDQSLMH